MKILEKIDSPYRAAGFLLNIATMYENPMSKSYLAESLPFFREITQQPIRSGYYTEEQFVAGEYNSL